MKRLAPILLLVVFGLSTLVYAGTWIRDDSGAPAPPNVFEGSGGQQTPVNATDRLPVQTATEAAGGPTTSSSDPLGWGKQFLRSASGPADPTEFSPAAFFTDDTTVYAFSANGTAASVNPKTWWSRDGGRTFTLINTSSLPDFRSVRSGMRFGNAFLVGVEIGTVTSGNESGLARSATGNNFSRVNLPTPCTATGVGCSIFSMAGQGTTALFSMRRSTATYVCRSTDSGATVTTCVDHAAVGGGAAPLSIASPAASTWIVATADGAVARSMDDGVSFSSVLTMTGMAGSVSPVTCLSATICLASNGGDRIWRSIDAGATWSLVLIAAPNPGLKAFANFGSGVVVVLGTLTSTPIWRSTDFGETWIAQASAVETLSGLAFQSTDTRNGRTIVGTNSAAGVELWYSPVAGPADRSIVGESGFKLDVDSSGRLTANQGAAAAQTGRWPVFLSDGTNERGTSLSPLGVSPIQGATLFNSQQTGAADTPVTVTIAATASVRAHVYAVHAFCSAGTSTLTITDGGATIWGTTAGEITTARFQRTWTPGLTGATNSQVVVTLTTCGAANTGTLHVQADRF